MPQEFFQYLPATSQAPQPRQWFAEIADESILRLPDPLDAGTPDLAPAEIWRDYVRTVNLRSIVAAVLDALGLDPRLAPERCWNVKPISGPTNGWTGIALTQKGRGCRYDRDAPLGRGAGGAALGAG